MAVNSKLSWMLATTLCVGGLVACGDDNGATNTESGDHETSGNTAGDGDGDSTGDGDGDSTGDGDGDSTGDGDGDSTGDGDGDSTGDGDGDSTGGGVDCGDEAPIEYAANGLPLLESNPGAPIALFLDYDGGTYHSNSEDTYTDYVGYSRDGDFANFDDQEQADIVASWRDVSHYFAMFDVNVTTIDQVREDTGRWGWLLISEDYSGGKGSKSSSAIGTDPYARAIAGSSTARIEDGDRSRRIAHELGHNFTLEHSGVWDNGEFYKWEDWPDWDEVYGPIMGGGGYGDRNGWSDGHHQDDPDTLQDTMEIIRQRVVDVGGQGVGWREDDFDGEPVPLCAGGDHLPGRDLGRARRRRYLQLGVGRWRSQRRGSHPRGLSRADRGRCDGWRLRRRWGRRDLGPAGWELHLARAQPRWVRGDRRLLDPRGLAQLGAHGLEQLGCLVAPE